MRLHARCQIPPKKPCQIPGNLTLWEQRHEAIRKILAALWNPAGVEDSRERYAYVDAVDHLYKYLSAAPTLQSLIDSLRWHETYGSGFSRPASSDHQLTTAAEQLLALDIERKGPEIKPPTRRKRRES
jgi:hypothetical protein